MSLLGSFGVDLFDGFWDGFGVQVGANIHQKSVHKDTKSKIPFWMDFGWLLDRFGVDLGGQVGAKLALKSVQEGVETDVKKLVKKKSRGPHAADGKSTRPPPVGSLK